MRVVWFSWKDRLHPQAGGAETVSGEIMDRLAKGGHEVTLITSLYTNAKRNDKVNGVNVIRAGGRYSVYLKAYFAYKNNFPGTVDLVIDELNTMPFMAALYTHSKQKVLLAYQLAREVWFYQMIFPLSVVGYFLEPLMLLFLSYVYKLSITESESSRTDILKYKFRDVRTFRIGMALKPVKNLTNKHPSGVVLSLGAIRPMKRTLHAVKAFEVARDQNPELTMIIAGDTSSRYAQKLLKYISASRHTEAFDVRGRVSNEERLKLMARADIILVTSIKEGWGLIVTEANSQGTPAIVYDTDGLRDSVRNHETGIVCPRGDYRRMGIEINNLINNYQTYQNIREAAWEWSKQFTFDNSYRDFINVTKSNIK